MHVLKWWLSVKVDSETVMARKGIFTMHISLMLHGSQLLTLSAMYNSVLNRIHKGFHGVVKCKQHAREAVCWPWLSGQLNELILNCWVCIKEQANPFETLMPSKLPKKPWQKVGTDMFTLGNNNISLWWTIFHDLWELINKLIQSQENVVATPKTVVYQAFQGSCSRKMDLSFQDTN